MLLLLQSQANAAGDLKLCLFFFVAFVAFFVPPSFFFRLFSFSVSIEREIACRHA